jgi:hypothetical protein
MGLVSAMLLAMGLFLGTGNNTQGNVNKNNANDNAKIHANDNAGFFILNPGEGNNNGDQDL